MSRDAHIATAEAADELLSALGEQLAEAGETYDLIAIGGSALLALGFDARVTRDIDVVAIRTDSGLTPADPLPEALDVARRRVARDFGVADDWLNAEPTGMLRDGLPDGFTERLTTRAYGSALTVRFASRFDQIHFKFFALLDRGPGKHEHDLKALEPTRDELVEAARWCLTQDIGEGHPAEVRRVLAYLGVEDAELGA